MQQGNWHKRHAIQIVAQLPENKNDALKVLAYAKELVEEFLHSESRLTPRWEVIADNPKPHREGERQPFRPALVEPVQA
jgi:hypothetical protein